MITVKILAIGDVCGRPGVDILRAKLHHLKKTTGADLVIVNGENACLRGISPELADEIFYAGADVITLGNHTFANRQICDYLDERRDIIRPYNLHPALPGRGYTVVDAGAYRVCVANLIGRHNMDFHASCPFAAADSIFKEVEADLFVFDFHAESTSEKRALGFYLDGRAAAVWGTHTHIPTADACVLPKGTAYITDLGMTGGIESVIGVKAEQSVQYFRGFLAPRFEASDKDVRIQGFVFETDGKRALSAQRVELA
jgi:metallophosphoesterase (TIGR00282 family)